MPWSPDKPIHAFTDLDLIFPACNAEYFPPWDDIPEEFKTTSSWRAVAINFAIGQYNSAIHPMSIKEGFSQDELDRYLKYLIETRPTKHQHKEAAIAYVLSLCCNLHSPEEVQAKAKSAARPKLRKDETTKPKTKSSTKRRSKPKGN